MDGLFINSIRLRGHHIHSVRTPVDSLNTALRQLGFEVFVLDGLAISDKASFFDEAARVFSFPGYFGKNWDAFHDCLVNDFVEGHQHLAIVWNDVENILSSDLQTFVEAISYIYADISTMPEQVEIFLIGKDDRFPLLPL
jgi:RNAse (barnase) inhibitor barstar